jgi:hypothetical protein
MKIIDRIDSCANFNSNGLAMKRDYFSPLGLFVLEIVNMFWRRKDLQNYLLSAILFFLSLILLSF